MDCANIRQRISRKRAIRSKVRGVIPIREYQFPEAPNVVMVFFYDKRLILRNSAAAQDAKIIQWYFNDRG